MEDKKEEKKKKKIKLPIIPVILIIIVIVAIINFIPNERKEQIHFKTTLINVTNKSELQTAKVTYNVIAKQCKNDNCDKSSNNIDNFKYVASCKGTVTVSLDFSKVKIDFDKKDKTYKIKIPKATISDVNVVSKSFIKGEKLPGTEVVEAEKLCKNTIKEKAESDDKILPAAREQAKGILDNYYSQLIKLFNQTNKTDYKYVIEEVNDEE